MILVHPPIAKPSEPPPGLARLAGALKRHGVPCRVLDANLEGILYLLNKPVQSSDTWTTRALRHLAGDLEQLRSREGYLNSERYRQSVLHLNRILSVSSGDSRIRISFANYTDESLSPLKSGDLLRAAEKAERNPFYPCFAPRLEEVIETEPHGAIGFSLNYLSQALCTFAMAGFIRKRYPSMRIVLGGGLATSWMRRDGWSSPFGGLIDEMVAGPGERRVVELSGKSYESGAEAPVYEAFLGCRYFAPDFLLPLSTSTGCYWHRCRFCPEEAEGNTYRPIPPSVALEGADALAKSTGASLIHFVDNALSPGFLRAVAGSGFKRSWYGFVRASSSLADPSFARALKTSGCRMLKLGVESGSQEVLDRLEKGIDLGTVSRVLKTLHSAGIGLYVYLLFGTPPENLEKARETLSFAVGHSGYIDFLNVAIFNMPVCGRRSDDYETAPFYEGDLSLYTGFRHPLGWDRNLVRGFLEKEFNRHPAIARILRRDPPLFTSNHAPFLLGNAGSDKNAHECSVETGNATSLIGIIQQP